MFCFANPFLSWKNIYFNKEIKWCQQQCCRFSHRLVDIHGFSFISLFLNYNCVLQFVDRQHLSIQGPNNTIKRSNFVSLLLQAQLQDAKRRWEELQNFLHSVNAEREKLQASKQGNSLNMLVLLNLTDLNHLLILFICVFVSSELHSQLVSAESEINNKMKEIQTLRSSLTEAMVSKERLEQQVEFMEVSQHSVPDESLQARVQVRWTPRLTKHPCENVWKWLWTEQCKCSLTGTYEWK